MEAPGLWPSAPARWKAPPRLHLEHAQYFQTMGVPILAGRDFNDRDTDVGPAWWLSIRRWFLISGRRRSRRRTWHCRLNRAASAQCEIVGLVKDTKYAGLREEIPPEAFGAASQFPPGGIGDLRFPRVFVLSAMLPEVQTKVAQFNPEIEAKIQYPQQHPKGHGQERTMAFLSGAFGALAILLTTIGLYGVISYIVAIRGERNWNPHGPGCQRSRRRRHHHRQTVRMLAVGVALGVVCFFAATRREFVA